MRVRRDRGLETSSINSKERCDLLAGINDHIRHGNVCVCYIKFPHDPTLSQNTSISVLQSLGLCLSYLLFMHRQ